MVKMDLCATKLLLLIYILAFNRCLSHTSTQTSVSEKYDPQMQDENYETLLSSSNRLPNFLNKQRVTHPSYSTGDSNEFETLHSAEFYSHLNYDSDTEDITCNADIQYTLQSIAKPWAMQMIDSFGKPESGILEGNAKWLGNYKECLDVYAPPSTIPNTRSGNFHGKYCILSYNVQISKLALSVSSGVCIPDTCNFVNFTNAFAALLKIADTVPFLKGNIAIANETLACKPTSRSLDSPTIAVIILLVFFGIVALLGSSITVYENSVRKSKPKSICQVDDDGSLKSIQTENGIEGHILPDDSPQHGFSRFCGKCIPFLKCFCLITNGSKLQNTDATEGQLLCLHGIRFLSMTWVILCHVFLSFPNIIRNFKETLQLLDNVAYQTILNGFFSVDSFFVLSGFLLTFLFLQEYTKRNGEMSWTYFYVHRYIRLTPVYMVVLGFSTTIYFYLGSGPYWSNLTSDPNCKTWWWNLLYINNFLDTTKQCMGWTWYLANDMQFFIISPLFLISLFRWKKIGFSLLGLFAIMTFLANFIITYHYDLVSLMTNLRVAKTNPQNAQVDALEYFNKIYDKPYTRIGPYLVGIFMGYIIFQDKVNKKSKFNLVTLCCGWAAASAVALTCVYGMYDKDPTTVASSFYNALSRPLFAVSLAWVIYVCLTDQGGFVNTILSYKLFVPLSRLTYCAYLVHPLVINAYFTSVKAPLIFSNALTVISFFGLLVASYGIALIVSLIFESPIIQLEKLVRTKFRS